MKRYWPVALVLLIGSAFSANLLLLYLATTDPDFSVEPDYYAKALDWDRQRLQADQNARLGWTAELTVEPKRSIDGSQVVQVRITDESAQAVVGASVSLTAFSNARAADRQHVTLLATEDGSYRATLRFHRPGLWEFRLGAERGDDVFTDILLQDVWARPPSPLGATR
jgi:nitrogen fixation protein FixH